MDWSVSQYLIEFLMLYLPLDELVRNLIGAITGVKKLSLLKVISLVKVNYSRFWV